MSTKIYGGIRFHDTDFPTLHGKLIAAGIEQRKAAIRSCNEILIRSAVERADRAKLNSTASKRWLFEAKKDLAEKIEDANRNPRCSHLWMGFEVSVMPFEGRLYGITHGTSPDKAAFANVGFDDFHYQDQTDPPENLAPDQWAERLRVWTGIFVASPDWQPSEVSSRYALVPKTPEWGYGKDEDLKPILAGIGAERFERLAAEALWHQALDGDHALKGFDLRFHSENPRISELMSQKTSFNVWLTTSLGKEALQEKQMDIAGRLKASLSLTDLGP